MTPFVFFKHRGSAGRSLEQPPSFEIELFDAREPALDYGRRLLARDALCAVVVTENDAEIAVLTRAN